MAATAADTSSAPAAAESSGELQRRLLAVLGGVVADAAATSTHWVYDVVSSACSSANVVASRNSLRQLVQDRIAEVAKAHNGGDVAFVPPSKTGAYHDGVPAYFAHKSKVHGDVSHAVLASSPRQLMPRPARAAHILFRDWASLGTFSRGKGCS